MSSTATKSILTPEEYLVIERKADRRSEYLNGDTFAMSGASPRHVLIVTNIVRELGNQTRKRHCAPYSTDLRIRVDPTGLYTYPDVVVICGELKFADGEKDTVTNPKLIVEVLSDSTKDYDRGGKFSHYRSIEGFEEYVLVAQDEAHVEHFVRQPDQSWRLTETNRIEDTIELPSIGCRLALVDIYDKIQF